MHSGASSGFTIGSASASSSSSYFVAVQVEVKIHLLEIANFAFSAANDICGLRIGKRGSKLFSASQELIMRRHSLQRGLHTFLDRKCALRLEHSLTVSVKKRFAVARPINSKTIPHAG